MSYSALALCAKYTENIDSADQLVGLVEVFEQGVQLLLINVAISILKEVTGIPHDVILRCKRVQSPE